jgi:hypothetical protein
VGRRKPALFFADATPLMFQAAMFVSRIGQTPGAVA